MKKTICMVMILVSVLTLSSYASEGSGIPPKGYNEAEARKYVEGQLDKLTLGPSAGTTTFYPDGSSTTCKPADTISKMTADDLIVYANKVFELVNQEREKVGVAPLERDDTLDEAANIRAQELVELNSHTRPNGNKFFSVLDDLGISWKSSRENIYRGPSTPERAMQGWMGSEGHRSNILKEKNTAMGIGIYQGQNGKLHWVQLFVQEK